MASSDQMTRLAERAEQAEEHTADTRERARADLEQDIASARASAEAGADRLRERADATETNLSDWWIDVQQSWDRHVTMVRKHIDERKAEHDRDRAETGAKIAEDDAQFATTRTRPSRRPSTPSWTPRWPGSTPRRQPPPGHPDPGARWRVRPPPERVGQSAAMRAPAGRAR